MNAEFRCCICQKHTKDKNILMVKKKAPIPGTGWGCIICNLPADGAIATLCNECLAEVMAKKAELKYVCEGYAPYGNLVDIKTLSENFDHDEIRHAIFELEHYQYLH